MGTVSDKLLHLSETKQAIKDAITEKGVTVSESDTFRNYPDKIRQIESGSGGIDRSIIDGTVVDLVLPEGLKTVGAHKFRGTTELNSADIRWVENIGEYAFYECKKLNTIIFSNRVKNISDYAFYYAGRNNNGKTFDLYCPNESIIGKYAFYNSRIINLKGFFSRIDTYAFSYCESLESINIEVNGSVLNVAFSNCTKLSNLSIKITGALGGSALSNCTMVNDFFLDPNSVITEMGSYAFSGMGRLRKNNSEENTLLFDFRKSTFEIVPEYAFGHNQINSYGEIFFPATARIIEENAFRCNNHYDYYFLRTTPPALLSSACWALATNYNIFVPYSAVNAYRTATNWVAQEKYIKGFSIENQFLSGYVLPIYSVEGYGLTWYSDKACTIPVSRVTDSSIKYYCVVGTEKIAYGIKSISVINCVVTISDNEKSYTENEGVLSGTVLTITATPNTEGFVPYLFTVNGEVFTNGSSITANSDLTITAIYYDGENLPYNPIFAENSWDFIHRAFREKLASIFWQVGDTKPVTLINGQTMNLRIVDMQSGRYELAKGNGYSNGVLEFVELMQSEAKIDSNSSTLAWASCDMKTITMEEIYGQLPDDLKASVSEVIVWSGAGSKSLSTTSSRNKLFLPSEWEMLGEKINSVGSDEGSPQFDYYRINNTNTARIKKRNGTPSYYWLRSPSTNSYYLYCNVRPDGSVNQGNHTVTGGVSPCFAI